MEASIPAQNTSTAHCSFCGQEDNKDHACRSEAWSLLNRLAQTKSENPFSQVENLVFQGGGVKGIAYVGVVKELFDEHKLHDQLKRIAGSSAGSIAALYVALGLSTATMEEYMNANMLEKLETAPSVIVDGESYSIKDVFDKVLDFAGSYTQEDVVALVKDVIGNLLTESLSWWKGPIAAMFASGTVADALGGYLTPSKDIKKTIKQRVQELEKQIKKEEDENNPHQIQQDQPKKGIFDGWFDKPSLDTSTVFHKALSTLLYQTFFEKKPTFSDGWFPGEKVKEDLIKTPIEEAFKMKGLKVPDVEKMTFADMVNVTVDGKPAFKKLYVTAFNTVTRRTEVFSVDHTPNVVVIDAVRASMSIPAFFESVPIREKDVNANTYPVRRMYLNDQKYVVTRYLDGGLLDNYPIWIFDDLQYCLGEDSFMGKTWTSKQRIDMRNPFTLGIKLIDPDQRKLFMNPYLDDQRIRQRAFSLPETMTVGNQLFAYLVTKSEDNQHIQRYDGPRTIYIDNLGVTAVSFKLSLDEKNDLQKSGRLGVRQYLNYAKWGKLPQVGQNYNPIQRPPIIYL